MTSIASILELIMLSGYQGGGMDQMGAVETVDMLIPQNKVGLVIGELLLLTPPLCVSVTL